MTKEDKRGTIIAAIGLTLLVSAASALAVFIGKWDVSVQDYEDVKYSWAGDYDCYEVFIEDVGYFTIPTEKVIFLHLPENKMKNFAIVQKEQTIFKTFVTQHLKRLYINICPKEVLS